MACWAAPTRGAKAWRSVTDTPYRTERVAAPPEIRAEMQRLAALHAGGLAWALWRGLSGIGFVLVAVYGIIALIDIVFGVIEPAHWFVLVLGSIILLLPMVLVHLRHARLGQGERDAAAAMLRAQAASAEVLRHTLLRDARHWFVEHQHGVIHVCPADPARTLYQDLSGITDDARHDHWYAKGLIDRTRWTWFTTPDTRFLLGFEADGDALSREILAERATDGHEAAAALLDFLGDPADGALVARPFAAVDAFLRGRAAP